MKNFVVFTLLLLLSAASASAQWGRRHKPHWPKTEGEMMHKLMGTLQKKDTAAYFDLFPTFDTLWSMVMHNSDQSPETQKALTHFKEHPQVLIEFDPLYNRTIVGGFAKVLSKGEDSGLNWEAANIARYELRASEPIRSLMGYEKIAPERFQGYMFVNDASTRTIYCIRVAEIQKIKNKFFGGQLLNILPAKTVDEFNTREQQEQDYFAWLAAHPDFLDSIATAKKIDTTETADTAETKNPLQLSAMEEDDGGVRKDIIVERKYYEGTLDKEIPIVLYVRYMKVIPGKQQQFDGLYKLGEHKRFLKLEITKTAEGKWIIEDESAVGTMELTLTGRKYTGSWSNADDNGYDVELTQTGAPGSRIESLDKIIDQGVETRSEQEDLMEESVEEAKKEKKRLENEKKKKEEEERKKEKARKKEQKKKDRQDKKKNKKNNDTPDSNKGD